MTGAHAVSIITPAYKAEAWIGRAVRSVLAQTMSAWEMIIIADDQQDYKAILKAQGITDSRLRFISTGGIGTGVSQARNTGLNAASADIIAMLDADDLFYSSKLECMLPMAKQYGASACAMNYVRYEGEHKVLINCIGVAQKEGPLGPDIYLTVHYTTNAMLVFDRNKVTMRWPEELPAMEDLTFGASLFDYVPSVYHFNEPLHEYVLTKDSFSTSAEAPGRFIAAKQIILDMMKKGTFSIRQPQAAAAYKRYVEISLAVEEEYAEAMKNGHDVSFTTLLEKRLFAKAS